MAASKKANGYTATNKSAAPKTKPSRSRTKAGHARFGSECTKSSRRRAGACRSNTKIGSGLAKKRMQKGAQPAKVKGCRLQAPTPKHVGDRPAQRKDKHLRCAKAPAKRSSKPGDSCQVPALDGTNEMGKGNGRPNLRLPIHARHTGVTSVSNAPGHAKRTREDNELGQLSNPSS